MRFLKFLPVMAGLALLAGCAHPIVKKASTPQQPATQVTASTPDSEQTQTKGTATPDEKKQAVTGGEVAQEKIPENARIIEPNEEQKAVFRNILFDYDKYNLTPEARDILKRIGQYLLDNPEYKIVIQGNCDERGTREYNLVLGEQRALAARKYLIAIGIAPARLFTVSYGKDNPEDPDHNEAAWAKNRRDEFKFVK